MSTDTATVYAVEITEAERAALLAVLNGMASDPPAWPGLEPMLAIRAILARLTPVGTRGQDG